MTEWSLEKIKEDAEECLAHHGPDKFCDEYDCRTVLEVFTALEEAKTRIKKLGAENMTLFQDVCDRENWKADAEELKAQRDKQEDVMKEQVEIAYRAGIEDGWMNPEGNMENMTYEYMKYLEAK